jgi:hypothetical protein
VAETARPEAASRFGRTKNGVFKVRRTTMRNKNHHSLLATLVGGLLFLFAATRDAAAQFIPPGSYQGTCREIKLERTTLKAICAPKDKGSFSYTPPLELVFECDGDIWNDDGKLRCKRNRNSLLNNQAKASFRLASFFVYGSPPGGDENAGYTYAWISMMFGEFRMPHVFFAGTTREDAEKVLKLILAKPSFGYLRKQVIDKAIYLATGSTPTPTEFAFWEAKIMNGAAWYATISDSAKQEMNKKPPARRLMIRTAYVMVYGREPTEAEIAEWQARTDNFGSTVEHHRNRLYSPKGAADLAATVTGVLQFNLKRNPTEDEVKTAIGEYRKKRQIFFEMRGAMPAIYY